MGISAEVNSRSLIYWSGHNRKRPDSNDQE